MHFIDTNIFLRVLVKEDKKTFNECVELLSLVRDGKIKAFTYDIVLAEVNWTLSSFYKFPKTKAVESIESILNLKSLKFYHNSNIALAVQLYKEHNIKFIDALIASDPNIFNKETIVISYDKDFDKLKLLRQEPAEVIKSIK